MGSWLALGNAANIPAGLIWAALESSWIRKKVDTLTIRRRFEGMAGSMEGLLFLVYAFAPSPLIATLACESRLPHSRSPLGRVVL